jgi:hypothetical protein
MKKLLITIVIAGLATFAWPAPAAQTASKPDLAKALGTWDLEVDADGQIFSLTMILEKAEGGLAGKVSEQNSMFTDAPLAEVSYDGEILKCTANVPTPPDMATRPWTIELKFGLETVEGMIGNAELMISASITGKRTKK